MADFSEGEDDSIYNVELEQYEGDQDLIIASKDFEKVANSCIKGDKAFLYILILTKTLLMCREGMWREWRQAKMKA